jgi:hypothetical protein
MNWYALDILSVVLKVLQTLLSQINNHLCVQMKRILLNCISNFVLFGLFRGTGLNFINHTHSLVTVSCNSKTHPNLK